MQYPIGLFAVGVTKIALIGHCSSANSNADKLKPFSALVGISMAFKLAALIACIEP